jgi:hypothetical protein
MKKTHLIIIINTIKQQLKMVEIISNEELELAQQSLISPSLL